MTQSKSNQYKKSTQNRAADATYGRIQPQALEEERAVLGGLLIDRNAYEIVGDILKPESFYEPRHQTIYEAIQSLVIENKPVDILTVKDALIKMGKLEEIGGPVYLAEISEKVASSANIDYHANVVAQKALLRNIISVSSIAQTKAFDETNDPEEVLQEVEQSFFELGQRSDGKSYDDLDSINFEVDKQLRLNASGNGTTGITSGFAKLDEMTAGFQQTDLIILAGRPSMGKTALAISIIKNTAIDYDIPVGFLSMEMNKVQVGNRLMSNICGIEGNKFLSGQFDPSDWLLYDEHRIKAVNKPLYVDDTSNLSIFEVMSKARRMKREHDIKLLIIDYLQLMNSNGIRFNNRQEEVSNISRALKGLAKELNIPIIALSQLNRSVEAREGLEGKRPQLSDLRESGAIEQDADLVLFVHRPEYYHIYQDDNGRDLHGMAQIIVAKHRKGAIGDVLLTFSGEFTRFENPEDKDKNNSLPSSPGNFFPSSPGNLSNSSLET